jgi:tetratricopeptide (TPR) repeat protein
LLEIGHSLRHRAQLKAPELFDARVSDRFQALWDDAIVTNFLDTLPLDFHRPEVKELHALLSSNYLRVEDIVRWLQNAGVDPAQVNLEASAASVWRDALIVARQQDRLRSLLTDIAASDDSAVATRVSELLSAGLQQDTGAGKLEVGMRLAKAGDNFKDRVSEQARIESLLANPHTRAVVVVGRPGIGKTELASHVVENLVRTHPRRIDKAIYRSAKRHGQIALSHIFTDCRDLVGGDEAKHLDRVWSNSQITVEEKVTRLLEALQDRRVVILLDNFETLLTANRTFVDSELGTFVNQLLDAASEVRLVVTSLAPPVFDTPTPNLISPLVPLDQGLPDPDAIDLLKSFGVPELDTAPAEQLRRLVRVTGGVPRALELCASNLAGPLPPTIDEMIENFFNTDNIVSELFLSAYKSLGRDERIILQSLSVFTRPVLPNAVDYLTPDLETKTTLDSLHSLATRHLVSFDRETRLLSLHSLDQDYLYRQVSESGKENMQQLESRAASYWRTIRKPEETWQTLRDVEPQLQEYAHQKRAEDWDAAAEVLASLDTKYRVVTWDATHFLARRLEVGPHIVSARLRLQNSFALGMISSVLGPQEKALQHFEEVRKAAEQENEELYRQSTGWAGVTYRNLGQLDKAAKMVKTAAKLNVKVGDSWNQAWWMAELALIKAFQRRPREALEAGLLARQLAEALRSDELLGRAADVLGIAYFQLNRLDDATREAATAREMDDRVKVPDIGAFVRNLQGMIALRRGNAIEAESAFQDVASWGHDLSSQRVEGLGLLHWAIALRRQGDHLGAHEKAFSSVELLSAVGETAATPARHLLAACRAHLRGEAATEIRELIEYLRSATADADMYCTDDILDEAAQLARDADLNELLADDEQLRFELNTYDDG